MNTTNDKNSNTANARGRVLVWALIGLLVIGLIASLIFLRPSLTGLLVRLFPSKGCNPPTLTLGTRKFEIKTIQPEADGSLKVPVDSKDIAYWIKGTDTNQGFALSPTAENLTLETSLTGGNQATVTLANCNTTTYDLSTPQAGVPDISVLLDPSISGITIFVQPGSATKGFVVKGELTEETIQSFDTPNPSEPQAEISLLGVSTSADGKTIKIGISILNTGKSSLTLSTNDISLTDESGAMLTLTQSEPALPQKIQPSGTDTIYLTYHHPSSTTATLTIFSVEYSVEGY